MNLFITNESFTDLEKKVFTELFGEDEGIFNLAWVSAIQLSSEALGVSFEVVVESFRDLLGVQLSEEIIENYKMFVRIRQLLKAEDN